MFGNIKLHTWNYGKQIDDILCGVGIEDDCVVVLALDFILCQSPEGCNDECAVDLAQEPRGIR